MRRSNCSLGTSVTTWRPFGGCVVCATSRTFILTSSQIVGNKFHNMTSEARRLGYSAVQKYIDRKIKACPDHVFFAATSGKPVDTGTTPTLTVDALPHTHTSHTSRSKNPLFRALMSRAPSALNLWSEAHKDLIAEKSQGIQFAHIGERRAFTARLYEEQPAVVHEQYAQLATAKAEEMKNRPDAVWEYVCVYPL